MKKAEMSQSKEDMIHFFISCNFTKKCKIKVLISKKAGLPKYHVSLLAWPSLSSTLVQFPPTKPCYENGSEHKDMHWDEKNCLIACSLEETGQALQNTHS